MYVFTFAKYLCTKFGFLLLWYAYYVLPDLLLCITHLNKNWNFSILKKKLKKTNLDFKLYDMPEASVYNLQGEHIASIISA